MSALSLCRRRRWFHVSQGKVSLLCTRLLCALDWRYIHCAQSTAVAAISFSWTKFWQYDPRSRALTPPCSSHLPRLARTTVGSRMKTEDTAMSWDDPIINSRYRTSVSTPRRPRTDDDSLSARFLTELPLPLTCAAVEPPSQYYSWPSAPLDYTFPSTTYPGVSPFTSPYGLLSSEYDQDCKEEIVEMHKRRDSWESWSSTTTTTSEATSSGSAVGRRGSTDEPASFVSTVRVLIQVARVRTDPEVMAAVPSTQSTGEREHHPVQRARGRRALRSYFAWTTATLHQVLPPPASELVHSTIEYVLISLSSHVWS